MKLFFICCFFLLLSCTLFSNGQNPGLRATINQSFLNEVNSLVPLFLNLIAHNISLHSQTGTFDVLKYGTIRWNLWGINITKMSLLSCKTIIEQGQIVEGIVDAELDMEAFYNWTDVNNTFYSDIGSLTVVVSGVSIGFNVEVGEANGRPTVASNDCEFSISGQLNFTFYGHIAWIYNDLEKALMPVIKKIVQVITPPLVEVAINVKAEEALAKLRVIVPDGDYLIDFSMLGPPVWAPDNSYFSFEVKGMYEPRNHPQPCPYTPAPVPVSLTNEMLQVFIGDYFLNCASWAHYLTGFFHRTIDPNNIPKSSLHLIETNTYQYVIPPLYTKYPDKYMSVQAYTLGIPTASFAPQGAIANANTQVDVSVIIGTNQLAPAFSFKTVLGIQLLVDINDTTNVLTGQIDSMTCDSTLISSAIGPFDFELFNSFFVGVCQYLIPSFVNIYLQNIGVPIPTFEGFEAVDPQIVYGKGYLGLYSSLKFSPVKLLGKK